MNPRNGNWAPLVVSVMGLILSASAFAHGENEEIDDRRWIQISANTKEQRSALASMGVSLESFRSDSVWGFATPQSLTLVKEAGFKVLSDSEAALGRGGHEGFDFPADDSRFHNYAETAAMLKNFTSQHADIAKVSSIGKSTEGRDILAIHINSSPDALLSGKSNKPGFIIMGAHHAREHLSVEIPLLFVDYLLKNREDAKIAAYLDNRDIWVIPMVNPDGAEWDISTGRYKMWRKNRRNNGDGTYGVDLNRNYGFMWGTGGSSTDSNSDVYMGKQPFSEIETTHIKNFVEAHLNAKVLLTVHTFSELILYPWGHKYDGIEKSDDAKVFETMAKTMAQWNHYTPQQSSDLYIASGDTTDWAYGEHGIFAFTFELSPANQWDGGFYPGQGVIDRVFNDNLRPLLYMLDTADDPYKVISGKPSGFLKNYVAPNVDPALFYQRNPLK